MIDLLTAKQRSNLAKLTIGVYEMYTGRPDLLNHFNMSSYWDGSNFEIGKQLREGYARELLLECGTCACFAGHGPVFGVEIPPTANEWIDYTSEFVTDDDSNPLLCALWRWLFSSSWPNDPIFAARRSAWVLQGNDVPSLVCGPDIIDFDSEFHQFTPDWGYIKTLASA